MSSPAAAVKWTGGQTAFPVRVSTDSRSIYLTNMLECPPSVECEERESNMTPIDSMNHPLFLGRKKLINDHGNRKVNQHRDVTTSNKYTYSELKLDVESGTQVLKYDDPRLPQKLEENLKYVKCVHLGDYWQAYLDDTWEVVCFSSHAPENTQSLLSFLQPEDEKWQFKTDDHLDFRSSNLIKYNQQSAEDPTTEKKEEAVMIDEPDFDEQSANQELEDQYPTTKGEDPLKDFERFIEENTTCEFSYSIDAQFKKVRLEKEINSSCPATELIEKSNDQWQMFVEEVMQAVTSERKEEAVDQRDKDELERFIKQKSTSKFSYAIDTMFDRFRVQMSKPFPCFPTVARSRLPQFVALVMGKFKGRIKTPSPPKPHPITSVIKSNPPIKRRVPDTKVSSELKCKMKKRKMSSSA